MAEVLQHPRVEMLATNALRPNPRNARTHSDKQVAQIAASIERFGFLVPIIVDSQGLIAAGHGRWLAAKQLKLASVPAIRADFLTDEDRRAFALAENRLAQLSGWDDKLLAEELEILFEGGYPFASLSRIAQTITGTKWSGPRFFGLKGAAPAKGGRDA